MTHISASYFRLLPNPTLPPAFLKGNPQHLLQTGFLPPLLSHSPSTYWGTSLSIVSII